MINVNVQDDIVEVNVSNAAGPAGPGVPIGGTAGQILKKQSSTNYDTYWALDGGGVPYSGATGDVDLGEYELKAGQVEFDQTPTGTAGVAVMRWNDSDGTLDLGLKGGNVTLQVGQEQVQRVVNKSGVNLLESAYQVVKVTSAQGQRLAVDLAQGNNDLNSTDTIGIVTETINNNQEGFITTSGIIRGINTTGSLQGETWVDGDVLYLSPTTAGAITKVKPTAPNHSVILGYVVYAHGVNGKIFTKCENGYEIGELHDCYLPTPSNNDGIFWNTANLRYQNNSIAEVLGYTPVTSARLINTTSPLVGGGDLSADRTLSIPAATTSVNGYLTSTDWTTFNNKVPSTRTLTINGTAYDLSADRSWTVSAANIYTADGTLAGDRTVTNSTFLLKFVGGQVSLGNEETALRLQTSTTGRELLFSLNNLSGKNWLIRSLTDGTLDFRNITNSRTSFSLDGASNDVTFNANLRNSLNYFFLGSGPFHRSLVLGKSSVTASNYSIAENGAETMLNADTGGLLRFRIANADKMMLTSAGRLLLGTTTESTFLADINGNARVNTDLYVHNASGEARIEIGRSTTGARTVLFSNFSAGLVYYNSGFSNYVYYYDPSTNTLSFQTNGSNRLTIDSTGAATFSNDINVSGVLKETITTNRQTASYTLALTDRGKLVEMNVATANNLTVPASGTVNFPIGTKIDISQYGAGQTTVVATGGVTVRSAGGALKLAAQYSGATLVKIGTDEWYLFGDITI